MIAPALLCALGLPAVDVTLVGAGPGFAGSPVMGHLIGIHADGAIHPQDFGMSPFFTTPIELVIDTEFDKPGK